MSAYTITNLMEIDDSASGRGAGMQARFARSHIDSEQIGVTLISAGSHTEPGGYTRRGVGHLHQTVRGRIIPSEFQDGEDQLATGQFEISDDRPPERIATILRAQGFDPVWKDWDQAISR